MHVCVRDVDVTKSDSGDEATPFDRWFARSKIVDRDGLPKIVFHGTYSDIVAFRPAKRRAALGFHFGSISQAEFFAGYHTRRSKLPFGCIMPVYLRIERPIRMPDIFTRGRSGSEVVAEWLFDNGIAEKGECAKIYRTSSLCKAYDRIINAFEAAGFDGVVYENEHEGGTATSNEDSYIAFRPEQVKSVFNRGTFEPANPDILL